ncbi:pyridoxal-phosphate dependent enzyme [Microlunatus elymi]|uniref:Pyridoxal-phosphate dependent enzyme n=1 Tax=Microlunatus elymi TaxID=2596828 RepID=A0A516PU03_9ACTN|nr:pyridoxal-phosphate dependent enzyme [Microlunatus elymi]QDP94675.1 pyridoxal-phosphate dependent enzyme [Microlunatus elymi]
MIAGYRCPRDGRTSAASELAWRCPDCGGPWDLDFTAGVVEHDQLPQRVNSLWRYAEALPLVDPKISFGEGRTPLVSITDRLSVKLDYLMPTLSFKDRGAVMLLEAARRLRPARVIADSSGNAGTAVAAYAARAGLPARIYVPASTSAKKIEQVRAHGAEVMIIDGDREATATAAQQAADEDGSFYASHVYNPYFLHGTKTYGYELWEDLGGRLPEVVVLPVGNGTLVLGVALAIAELVDHGLTDQRPRLVAVQAESVAPLARARAAGLTELPPGYAHGAETITEGIAIAEPARAEQILRAVDESYGDIVTVDDDEVRAAQRDLAGRGLYVEATAAACWAAVRHAEQTDDGQLGWRLLRDHETVAPLCGAGLKTGLA